LVGRDIPERGTVGERTLNKAVRMRSVRCDACGTKALVAASTCPKCGHGFEVRDNFGELLPLAHCTSCDSYYPAHIGSCRWCGTKPERSPIGPLGPHIWKGVGILTFASLAIGAWLAKNDEPSPPSPARTFVADTLPTNQPRSESIGRKIALAQPETTSVAPADSPSVAVVDSTHHDSGVALATVDTLPSTSTPVVERAPVPMQSAGTVAPTDSAPAVDPPPADPPPADPAPARRVTASARTVDPAPPRVSNRSVEKPVVRSPAKASARALAKSPAPAASTKRVRSKARASAPPPRVIAKAAPRPSTTRVAPAPKTTGRSSSGRWVTSIARNWAVVRSDPTRQSRIIAAIGPNTRVQLGETRGEWRRIKAKGLAGWVEHRRLVAQVVMPARTGRLAAR
jgi:hypothetical protein